MFDYYGQEYTITLCNLLQADIAGADVRLWKAGELVPSMDLTIAECNAAQCDFSGYAFANVTAWLGPYVWPTGGSYIDSGALTFLVTEDDPQVENSVGGYYIVSPSGEFLVAVGALDSPVPLAKPGDVLKLVIQLPQGVPFTP